MASPGTWRFLTSCSAAGIPKLAAGSGGDKQIHFPVWLTLKPVSPGTASSCQHAGQVSRVLPGLQPAVRAVGAAEAIAGSNEHTMDHDQSCASQGV